MVNKYNPINIHIKQKGLTRVRALINTTTYKAKQDRKEHRFSVYALIGVAPLHC